MTTMIEHATKALLAHLGTNETVIAATRAQLDGGSMRIATRIGASVGLGLSAGVFVADLSAPDDVVEAQFANGVVIAVTDSRIMLLDVTAVGARPKNLVWHIERGAVTSVVTGEKRVMLVKMMTIALTFTGEDSRQLCFEIPKVSRRDAEAVVAALGA